MKKELVFEPVILGVGIFALYLCSAGVLLSLAAIGDCGWKGRCGAPLTEFSLIMISHWIVVGLVIRRSILLAKWLMLVFGCIPFVGSILLGVYEPRYQSYFWVVTAYLFIFGILFTAYIWFSPAVHRYAQSLRA